MASIVYLDVDDEITKAAARIRESPEPRLAIVLPIGSRIATSRINFRLLVREAQTYGRDVAIVSPEQGTRALAASAGIAAFATVPEYETAVEEAEAASVEAPAGPDTPDDSGDAGGTGGGSPAGGASPAGGGAAGRGSLGRSTRGGLPGRQRGGSKPRPPRAGATEASAVEAAAARRGAPPASPAMTGVRARTGLTDTIAMTVPPAPQGRPLEDRPSAQRRRGPSALIVAAIGVLLIVLVATGAAAWLLLPTATVTVRSRAEPVGPLQFTVRADPLAVSVDEEAGVVPAQVVTFDLSVTDQFPASGKKVTETAASGTLRWTNCDPTRAYTIPSGTLARTADGTGFNTTDAVFLPVAILTGNPPTITCQSRVVTATAANPGLDGNAAAGAITVVPSAFNSVVIRVTNPAATTGGTHVEKTIVAQKDVDAAVAALTKDLRDQFSADVADPSQAPAGSTVYPGTKSMSAPTPTVDPATLVGQAGATFELGMTGSGTATAVDPAAVEQLGQTRVRAAVAKDRSLVAGSVSVTVGAGRVDGSDVLFPVNARAGQVAALDAAAIRAAVKGMSVDAARERLRDYGDATVDTWPAWVTTITTFDFRLAVTVISDVPTEPVGGPVTPPGPAASPAPSGTSRPTLPVVPTAPPSAGPSGSAGTGPSAPGAATPSDSTAVPSKAAATASPAPSGT